MVYFHFKQARVQRLLIQTELQAWTGFRHDETVAVKVYARRLFSFTLFSSLGHSDISSSSDSITLSLSLRFGDVTLATRDFTFYDCTAVKQLSGSTP